MFITFRKYAKYCFYIMFLVKCKHKCRRAGIYLVQDQYILRAFLEDEAREVVTALEDSTGELAVSPEIF